MGWSLDLGPVSFSNKGVQVKPQLRVGFDAENASIGGGVGDVRNGLRLGLGAEVKQAVRGEGKTLYELLRALRANGAGSVIDPIITLIPKIVAEVIRLIGVDISHGKLRGSFAITSGIGVSAAVALGWKDTEGYHLVGVGGKVAAGLDLALSIFAGIHEDKTSVKVLLTSANFSMKIYFWPTDKEAAEALKQSSIPPRNMETSEPE